MSSKITLADIFSEHAAVSLDKQRYLEELIGEHKWGFNLNNGTITFNNNLTYSIQILGTESQITNTWLWGWANDASDIPTHLLLASLELKLLGSSEHIEELTEPQLTLTREVNAHYLALIGSGICKANCYYRCPYERGALYLLIKDPRFKRDMSSNNPLARIAFIFTQLVADFTVTDQQKSFISYLQFYNLETVIDKPMVVGKTPNGDAITAEFDRHKRLVQLALRVN